VGRALDRYAALFEGRGMQYDEITRARTSLLEQVALERRLRARNREAPPTEDLFARLYGEGHPRVRRMRMRARAIERTDVESDRHPRARAHAFREPPRRGRLDAAALDRRSAALRVSERGRQPRAPADTASQPGATRLRSLDARSAERDCPSRQRGPDPSRGLSGVPPLRAAAGGMFSSRLNLSLLRAAAYVRCDDERVRPLGSLILDIMIVVPVSAAGHAAAAIVES
jgi:hypothetical protein